MCCTACGCYPQKQVMMQAINDIYSQSIYAKRFAVIDPETETILVSRNIHERCPIASITKLLTALLVVERGDLDRMVVICDEDLDCPDARVCLKPGNAYSRHELLACLLIRSASDAALALARDHSGEVESFVRLMNEKARALGMTSSLFCDPHGVTSEGHYSTALDVARLAMAVEANAIIRRVTSQYELELEHNDGEKIHFNNTNVLLKTLSICDGIKTGYTSAAGFCLVASASLGERRRIVIALGNTVNRHFQDVHHLLAWGLGQPLATQGRVTLQSLAAQENTPKGDVEVPFFYDAHASSYMDDSPCQTKQGSGGERYGGFEYFQMVYGKPCADWARKNLPPTASRTVLYPFGGPDILFPLAMFPQARDFILVGKELCTAPLFKGSMFFVKRAIRKIHRGFRKVFPRVKEKNIRLAPALESAASLSVKKTLAHYFRSSFFITTELQANLKDHSMPSILPLLLAQLVHAGYPVHTVDEIEHGAALRIVFGDREDPFRLYYFSQDLSDVSFNATMPLYEYLSQAESFITLIKSGSYLLPSPEFSRLSRFITDKGALLVQDPTGIPYDTLCERTWDVALHGRFFGDIPLFGERPEHIVLRAAYQAKGLDESLPFGFGYLKNPAIASIVVACPKE